MLEFFMTQLPECLRGLFLSSHRMVKPYGAVRQRDVMPITKIRIIQAVFPPFRQGCAGRGPGKRVPESGTLGGLQCCYFFDETRLK